MSQNDSVDVSYCGMDCTTKATHENTIVSRMKIDQYWASAEKPGSFSVLHARSRAVSRVCGSGSTSTSAERFAT